MNNGFQEQKIEQSNSRGQIEDGKNLLQISIAGLLIIVSITILQDLVHSRINNYSFYFSESLLFKAVWILFFPLLFVQFKFLKKIKYAFLVQTVLSVLALTAFHLFLVPLVILSFSAAFYEHTYSYFQTLTYTVSEDAYKLPLIYGLSALLYKYLSAKEIEEIKEKQETRSNTLEKIIISHGRKYTPISVGDILYFSAATPYVAIQLEDKHFLHTETLKSINEKLDKTQFVRVHKSTIVNLKKIVSYKSRLNGDYDLLLENGEKIRLSRNYSAEFKKHFKTRSQVNE